MDVHVHVTVLCLHSEYLAQLLTEVGTQLSALEQTLSEGQALTSADACGLLDRVASLRSRLSPEGEMFCQRLHLFLAEAKTGDDSREKISQLTSSI